MEFDVSLHQIEPLRSTAALAVGTVATAAIRLRGLPRGAVLLLCAGDGLETQAPELMNALAEHGYESLAADLTGLGLDDNGLLTAAEGLLGILGECGWEHEQIGVIGYAEGGRAALLAAAELVVGAAISLSPSGVLDGLVPEVRSPWLALFGELDPARSPEVVTELVRRLDDAPAFARVVVYPGADVAFFRGPAGALGHAAAFDSWQRVVEWLNVRVVPRPSPYAQLWALRHHQQPSNQPRQGSAR
jgi:carboxymethylenebutenolidase